MTVWIQIMPSQGKVTVPTAAKQSVNRYGSLPIQVKLNSTSLP